MQDDERDEFIPAHAVGSELDRGLTEGFPSDEELAVAVTRALTWDEQVDATSIQVISHNTVITLWGDVGSEEERQRAEAVTRSVAGVSETMNLLKVRGKEV